MAYKYFRGTLISWEELLDQAAALASEVGRDRVPGISHSSDRGNGVVAVGYWADGEANEAGTPGGG